ncbi:MAG: glucose/arabinose dehydrogenase/N-acetylneuraminic acid mutarotase [Desulforhopalus sp.]|jgi:glucose/arabinose dehydrogenase/N-acetylneuraminic acid mutarotase
MLYAMKTVICFCLLAMFSNVSWGAHNLELSKSSNRTDAVSLAGEIVSDEIFVFISPESDVVRVTFFLDGVVQQVENIPPYDFAGTESNDNARPFNTGLLIDGNHTVSAQVELVSGAPETVTAAFEAKNNVPMLSFSPTTITLSGVEDGSVETAEVVLDTNDGLPVDYELSLTPESPWLSLTNNSSTTPSIITLIADPLVIGVGNFTATITATPISGTYATAELPITFTVSSNQYSLLNSSVASRIPATQLSGQVASGDIHVFIEPTIDISKVDFFLDDPFMTGTPIQTERRAPHDFAGTASDDTAFPFSTLGLVDGTHTISALIALSDGRNLTIGSDFSVQNSSGSDAPIADFTFNCVELICNFDASPSNDPNGTIIAYNWNFGDGNTSSGVSPTHSFPATESYSVTLEVTDNDSLTGSTTKTISVNDGGGCSEVSLLHCSQVRIDNGMLIGFDGSDGGLLDQNGVGTGFTMVDPPFFPGNPSPNFLIPGYWPEKLTVDTNQGLLMLETTSGIQYQDNNNLDNALGIGLNVPSAAVTLKTTIIDLPATAPGGYAQAGLWFGSAQNFGRGTSEDDYTKVVISSPQVGQYILESNLEQNGETISSTNINISPETLQIVLEIIANPANRSIQARYELDGASYILDTYTNLPDEWFSFDQAGIDATLSTRSFGGIFATHRNASAPVVFAFDDFSVSEQPPVFEVGDFAFDSWQIPVATPTAITWGPDNRLYVAELFGTIHAFTLDHVNRVVFDEQIIDSIRASNFGNRLTLGLTTDPASTPENVILWVSHTDGSINAGQENSGKITRLSGTDFLTVEDRIVGLTRAIANHAINNIEFGPDGKLYIAAGGNTGAGSANLAPSEFGDRPEQPLSAAILVADVNNPDFMGECATPIGGFDIPVTCDVEVYASGLRNSYDIAWHHNGNLYATDNGLGVVGTVPPVTTPPCTGFADAAFDNPGTQPDLLHRIEQGKYYGHPNPYRNECVFKDGSFQGTAPLSNYTRPMLTLGVNLSANGIIEYKGDSFFSRLMGQLIIANFSIGDNLLRVELSDDGTGVVSSGNLIAGFSDPLPLAQDNAGNIYVGEMNASSVTVLVPLPLAPPPEGTWKTLQPAPGEVLDAGSGGIGGKLYMVGGKNTSNHLSTMYIYDTIADSWSTGPNLPGPAVENPAVVVFNDKLYVFGGSTAPFSGAVFNASMFDPVTSSWIILPSMSVARGGAVVKVINDRIYLVGGMNAEGASLSSVEIFNPATMRWSTGVPMLTRRDNPGAAVIEDVLYVFGGRTRNADGSVVNDTLASMEIYDPNINNWTAGPPMTTPRRAMIVGNISGRTQVMGGESPIVSENEEYNPATNSWRILTPMVTPRHGAASATIYGSVYVVGGGIVAGSSFVDINEAFSY